VALKDRLVHGAVWGAVATLVAGIVSLLMAATGVWPGPALATPSAFARILGAEPSNAFVLMLSFQWQLAYGAFWGVFLAYVSSPDPTRPAITTASPLAQGLGVGFLRWYVLNLPVFLALGWGAFGLLETPLLALATLPVELLFGVTASWLLARDERGALRFQLPHLGFGTR
jgi:hypothetical protein